MARAKRLQVRVTQEMMDRLDAEAALRGLTRSDYFRLLVGFKLR